MLNMEQQIHFDIFFMDEAMKFIRSLPVSAQRKIFHNADRISNGLINNELFKKLSGDTDLWEFRTLHNGIQYRLLAFWDNHKKRMVVATHGFVKKTWKIPYKEISKAESLRKKYYESNY